MSHPTVELEYILGEKVEIDEKIAAVIEAMWQLGARTSSSCQGDPGGERAHIILPTQDLVRLLDIISSLAPDDELYHRVAPWEWVTHEDPGRWGYWTSFHREEPAGHVRADTMVDFPHEDIPVLEGLLRRAVELRDPDRSLDDDSVRSPGDQRS